MKDYTVIILYDRYICTHLKYTLLPITLQGDSSRALLTAQSSHSVILTNITLKTRIHAHHEENNPVVRDLEWPTQGS